MNLGSDLLWLSEKDVASLLTVKDAIRITEKAFAGFGRGQVQMPPKIYLQFDPFGGDLRAMPAYVKGTDPAAGVKIVNSNPNNPRKKLPAVSGLMVLNDPRPGLPLGVFAAGHLTGIRTGAAGGVAAKYLARPNSRILGLVGCGRQARAQLDAILELFPITTVRVWGPLPGEAAAFAAGVRKFHRQKFVCSPSVAEACQADIVVTTTPARTPLVLSRFINNGTHINAIGADAPGKQELETTLLSRSRVVVDSWEQARHAGEINRAVARGRFSRENLAAELGQVIIGRKTGRRTSREVTVFDSTGLALQDVAVAKYLYSKALKQKKGKVLKFNG